MFYATYLNFQLLVNKLPPCVDMSQNEMPSCILALQRFVFNLYDPAPIALNLHWPHGSRTRDLLSYRNPISSLIQFVFPSTGSSELC